MGLETMLQTIITRRSLYVYLISNVLWNGVMAETQCWKRKYYVNIFGRALNATVICPKFYQWSVSDYCCYDAFDRFDSRPYCCYSETYKLLIAVGLICLVLLGVSICLFLCWIYNIPHYILYVLTCGKFSLLKYMKKTMVNGPYVDPSFYSGEPFWSPGNSDLQPYPLRPMPPRIFYPAVPRNMKSRWSKEAFPNGQMPLFILASRQFTRNPYSARPNERQAAIAARPGPTSASSSFSGPSGPGSGTGFDHNSRRSSTTSTIVPDSHRDRNLPTLNFKVNIDEVEAAAELLEAIRNMDDKCEKDFNFIIPRLTEETQMDLDLENEKIEEYNINDRRSTFAAAKERPATVSAAVSRRSSNVNLSAIAAMGSINFATSQSILEEMSLNTRLNTSESRQSIHPQDVQSKNTNSNIPGSIPEEKI